ADDGDARRAWPRHRAVARAGGEPDPQTVKEEMAEARAGVMQLEIRPLTAAHVDDVKTVMKGTWGSSCWDLFPRFSAAEQRELGITGGGPGTADAKRREVLAKLARRRKNSAGLVAYRGAEPIGFVSLGPRHDYSVVENSKVMPPVDDV